MGVKRQNIVGRTNRMAGYICLNFVCGETYLSSTL
jgi:hypothetical protein